MRKIFIFIAFFVLCTCLHAQYIPKADIRYLYKLEVINKKFLPVLDSVIRMKSEVEYYKHGPLFTICLDCDRTRTDLITIWAEGKKIFGADRDLGLFDYKGNTFIVRGDSLDTTIFSNTKFKRKFIYSNSLIEIRNGELVFLRFEERFCTWMYRYHNDNFKLLLFDRFDDTTKTFDYIEEEYQQNKD